jgi:hypothetical protein
MRKKFLAMVVMVVIMATEAMTVFAAEGGSESPTSKTVEIRILDGSNKKSKPSAYERELRVAKDFGLAGKSNLADKFGLFYE